MRKTRPNRVSLLFPTDRMIRFRRIIHRGFHLFFTLTTQLMIGLLRLPTIRSTLCREPTRYREAIPTLTICLLFQITFYARYFDGLTGDHFIAFSPVFFSSIIRATPGVIIGTADFLIGPDVLLPTIGIPPAQTVVTKVINTAFIFLPNQITSGGEANLD
jgi:hypothetical protein